MAVNKVKLSNGETLIDLSGDTVVPETLGEGVTAHDKSGNIIVGTATPVEIVHEIGTSTKAVISQKGITDEFAKRGQLKPEFANDISGCTDTSKLYVLPDGYIYAYMTAKQTVDNDNKILSSIGSDGNPYNGGTGYKDGYRLNSSGAESATSGTVVSGFIRYTGGDVEIRIPATSGGSYGYLHLYKSDFTWNRMTADGATLSNGSERQLNTWVSKYGATVTVEDNTSKYVIPATSLAITDIYYLRVSASATTAINSNTFDVAIGESVDGAVTTGYTWANTGHAFVPADYEDRILDLEKTTKEHEQKIEELTVAFDSAETGAPEYWMEELQTKAETIRIAMETAGSNKSAFLWYTDAHWKTNAKVSPSLLRYLCKNTSMNKVNFGGDIINDPNPHNHENTKYVYSWRKMISDLPNHHSVYGNHDVNHRTTDVSKIAYAQLIAPEETSDMVVGADSCYYIDNPSEKTRYLYLSYVPSGTFEQTIHGIFVVESLNGVQDGWHVVVIGHRWFQYTSASAPTVGTVPSYESTFLQLFDAYNARSAIGNYDFTNAKGKVEFCIGGHIHVDYDFTTDGGIPVIITASDTNQERSSDETEDCGTVGTTTESAVFGIIADYNTNKITIVGVGRGTSREISY